MARFNDLFGTNNMGRVKRFATVGMLGTLLDIGLFTLLRVLLGVPALAANTVSYSAGIVNNYVLHKRWTFADRGNKSTGAQFTQFVAVSLAALLLNNLLVLLLAPVFGRFFGYASYGDLAAKICATGVGMCWNYVANNFWTFAEESRGVES